MPSVAEAVLGKTDCRHERTRLTTPLLPYRTLARISNGQSRPFGSSQSDTSLMTNALKPGQRARVVAVLPRQSHALLWLLGIVATAQSQG